VAQDHRKLQSIRCPSGCRWRSRRGFVSGCVCVLPGSKGWESFTSK